jgi:hypothetical protein
MVCPPILGCACRATSALSNFAARASENAAPGRPRRGAGCACPDFASGIANPIDLERYVAINPDLTIAVEREPRSEWIGIGGETRMCGDGMGHSLGAVFDLEGRVARVQASLFVDERSKIGG